MTLRLPAEIEDQLKQVAEIEHRSVQQTVLVAIEEYLSMRETAEILADPTTLSADDVVARTEYALAGRFATIRTVEELTTAMVGT